MTEQVTIPVNLMGKTFSIKCKADETQQLEQSIAFLQRRLTTLRSTNDECNLERLLFIASLHLIHDTLHSDDNKASVEVNQHVNDLVDKIENALTKAR